MASENNITSPDNVFSSGIASEVSSVPVDVFPTISCLPPEVLKLLNDRYAPNLSSSKAGVFQVDSITVKIGKDVSSWKLTS